MTAGKDELYRIPPQTPETMRTIPIVEYRLAILVEQFAALTTLLAAQHANDRTALALGLKVIADKAAALHEATKLPEQCIVTSEMPL